ncbi:type II toxin-antitoxin system VapB family antitoxin [Prochlorothrix hollandica]|uniref:DUF2281 domain-containing protein n=1 Tax=Prochlorothrix hollandica PCC 9006 = CALU 1027 TaxID=317619 RepID=A0A0M2PSU1_PROHO|nr:DUF2281 domain-containing protein [Prochlorothrix hollandica]KKI99600.1 hypothetical protein PROH_06735 [Prochlorothrix hollandica PCC 9006 = CALU 1027]
MTVDVELLETLTQMPESLKQEVLHYAKYLNEKYSHSYTEEKPKKRRIIGSMKGTFNLPLPKDFDAPMELLDAEQKAALEKKYSYGSLAGKIMMSDDFDEPLEDLKDYI